MLLHFPAFLPSKLLNFQKILWTSAHDSEDPKTIINVKFSKQKLHFLRYQFTFLLKFQARIYHSRDFSK